MKYRELGRTGLKVSEIGLGCWAIGGGSYGAVRDEESLEALETGWEHGANFFDTADSYGSGHSEEILAQFIKSKDRDALYLATKVGCDFYDGPIKKNFSAEHIAFGCDQSLKRLGVDYIDVYQLHNPKLELIQRGEALSSLEELKKAGKIRFIGVSVHGEEEALACIEDGRVDTLQVVFNILDQRMAAKVFLEAKEKNVGIIVREPLARGFLTEKYNLEHEFAKDDHRRGISKERISLDLEKIDLYRRVLSTKRIPLARAALEYVLEFHEVGTVIPGVKTKEQVIENLLATEDPSLRAQEASQIRDLYRREPKFQKGLDIW